MSTTVTNKVLFGLKVEFNFGDIESKTTALRNLGLDIRDIEVIRGISGSINKVDLQNVSGLDTNLTRYLDRLDADTSNYNNLVNNLSGYNYATKGNLEAFGPISGGAVRFKYIPNDGGVGQNADNLKYGDISTSRVSSWSSATSDETNTTQAISYGGSVQVRGKLMLGQSATFNVPDTECLLNVLDTPEPVRFDTEVPTDIVKINFNGTAQYMYAMRGIPFIFTTAFKTISMNFGFNDVPPVNGTVPDPIYTFKATDGSEPELVSKPVASGTLSRLRFSAQSYKERDVRVYYPPGNITSIEGVGINLRYLPAAKFLALESMIVDNNLLGEMPDWRNINYVYDKGVAFGTLSETDPYYNSNSGGPNGTPAQTYNPPAQSLTYIHIGRNPLYLSEDEDLVRYGTNTVKRFPSKLTRLLVNGCYRENTEFLTAGVSLVMRVKDMNASDFNYINCHPTDKQEYPFENVDTGESGVGTPSGLKIKGIFYDKVISGSYSYVYIDEPEITIGSYTNFIADASATQAPAIMATYPNLFGKKGIFQPLDMKNRMPNLTDFNNRRNGNQVLYATSDTKRPDYLNPFFQINGGGEQTPRVEIKNIQNYTIRNNGFSLLSDEFLFPEAYLDTDGTGASENSALRTFNVYDNDSLSGQPNFLLMTQIRSINIGDTSLEIPNGLFDKTTLNSVSCAYSRFPNRPGTSGVLANGGGNPNNVNNHFFTSKAASTFEEYVFKGCTGLSSISMYSSRMDGFFPKLVGNNSMTSIDLRNTSIEGGRPENPSANNNLHGRTYIMWNDTFEDAQNITSIRIRSSVLGRSIGTWNGSTTNPVYTGASFEGATFNLPLLNTLEILCPEKRIRGDFFDPSQSPALQTLISYSTGWGLDIVDGLGNIIGTPCPSFAANQSIRYVDLSDNQFSGNLSLVGLSNLKEFYMGQNILSAVTGWETLPALEYLTISNNPDLGPDMPNLSFGSPNIRNVAMNNCKFINYPSGGLATCTRLRIIDLSGNRLNQSSVNQIMIDLVANYNAAPRSGVIVNLSGDLMAPPASEITVTPTINVGLVASQSITVNQSQFLDNGTVVDPDGIPDSGDEFFQPNPLDAEYIFGVGSNDPSHEININLRNDLSGTLTNGTQYETKVFLNGVQLNSEVIDINYTSETVTFLGNSPGNVTQYPGDGSTLLVQVWGTDYGQVFEETGPLALVTYLRNRNWNVVIQGD